LNRMPWLAALVTASACAPSVPEELPCDGPPALEVDGALDQVAPFEARLVRVTVQSSCPVVHPLQVTLAGDERFDLLSAPQTTRAREPARISFLAETLGAWEATLSVADPGGTTTIDLSAWTTADVDGDGYDDEERGGDDCDDSDPRIHPGAAERDNGLDDDCDGLVDEHLVQADDVVVTEVFGRPSGGDPSRALWVEVLNTTGQPRHLDGWWLELGSARLQVEGPLTVQAGAYAVLGMEPELQGQAGVPVDARLVGQVPGPGWEGVVLVAEARVSTAHGVHQSDFMSGRSLGLSRLDADPDLRDSWCPATSRLPSRERGTPGEPNDACALDELDWDGDGFTPLEGDCDDRDPRRHPGRKETWNRVDDDCDGITDVLVLDDVVAGRFEEYVGHPLTAVHADLDGDGVGMVAIAATSSRAIYLFDDGELLEPSPEPDVTIHVDPYSAIDRGAVASTAPDLSGDGVADLIVVSERQNSLSVWHGRPDDGSDASEADYQIGEGRWPARRTEDWVLGDLDGDGSLTALFAHNEVGVAGLALEGRTGLVEPSDVVVERIDGTVYVDKISAGDLDGDGYEDLVAIVSDSRTEQRAVVVRGRATPAGDLDDPDLEVDIGGYRWPWAHMAPLDDVDGDGTADLVLGSTDPDEVIVFDGLRDGALTRADARTRIGSGGLQVIGPVPVVDIDNDGVADVAALLSVHPEINGATWFLYGPLPAGEHRLVDLATGRMDHAGTPALVDLDGDGDRDLLYDVYRVSTGAGNLWSVEFE